MTEQRLELHYHLTGGSHSMDANVRNRCEAEALAALQYIAETLGIDVVVETTAHAEGGLREIWKFLQKQENANAVAALGVPPTLLIALIAVFVSIMALPPSSDKEIEAQTKEINRLTIEEKKLNIDKLRREAELRTPDRQTLNPVIEQFQHDYKIVMQRSNFYRRLLAYEKVEAVGFGLIPDGLKIATDESIVERSEFHRFVRVDDKLEDLVDDHAVIEIVAPVIDGSKVHWKGTYRDQAINFAMRDAIYRGAVASRQESFQHGDSITCVLHTERKLDAVGEIVVLGRYVDLVFEKTSGAGTVSMTQQGRKKRFDEKHNDAQRRLDLTQ